MNPFKAYDIRGVYPNQVNEELAYDIGRALPLLLKCKTIVVGRDGRTSSNSLYDSLIRGLLESGITVINIGQCSTPQFYYAIYSSSVDGGVMITASHNPKEYNGFKICEANAKPIFKENGLPKLQLLIEQGQFKIGMNKGQVIEKNIQEEYTQFFSRLKKESFAFSVLVDTGNGMGTYEMQAIKKILSNSKFEVLFEKVDGSFPNHECNPIIEKYYSVLQKKLREGKFNFGIAFDGDADRITFFTEKGMIPPDLITGLIGSRYAKAGEKVGFEVRTSQAVPIVLEAENIIPCLYPSGHAYIKQNMIKDGAVFAGEKSGHYFYQVLHNTDSSLFTLINIVHILSVEGKSLDELIAPLRDPFANSGEMNYTVNDANKVLKNIEKEFSFLDIKKIDGISCYDEDFFFNVRKSNTEPLVRVNIEALSQKKVNELKESIERIISRC